MANGISCSASMRTAPGSSRAGISGICSFLMISSRPQMPTTASVPVMPAVATAVRIAAAAASASRIAPSATIPDAIAVLAHRATAGAGSRSRSSMTFTAVDPMSRPKARGARRARNLARRAPSMRSASPTHS